MTSWIHVIPKNYRSIVLFVLFVHSQIPDALVYCNGHVCTDFSTDGQLTQRGIRDLINFKIVDAAGSSILEFHDHPNEMFISSNYSYLADHCSAEGWLHQPPVRLEQQHKKKDTDL